MKIKKPSTFISNRINSDMNLQAHFNSITVHRNLKKYTNIDKMACKKIMTFFLRKDSKKQIYNKS